MKNIKLQIYYRAPNKEILRRTITYMNPSITVEKILEFVYKLTGLTKNDIVSIYKVNEDKITPVPIDDDTQKAIISFDDSEIQIDILLVESEGKYSVQLASSALEKIIIDTD